MTVDVLLTYNNFVYYIKQNIGGYTTMTSFYVSPSALTMRQYQYLVKYCVLFGWKPRFMWPKETFGHNYLVNQKVLKKAAKAIATSDIFIAFMPGTISTCFEVGIAYSRCEEVLLVAKDPIYFTQTGMADAHIATLPNIKRVCGDLAEIPTLLQEEYYHLINIEQLQKQL